MSRPGGDMASPHEEWPPATSAVSGDPGHLPARDQDRVAAQVERPALGSLERLVRKAERPAPLHPAAPSLPRGEIVELRSALLGIAACLRDGRPVYAQGMALLWRLLTDGAGPAYDPRARHSLRRAVRAAAEALDGRWAGRTV